MDNIYQVVILVIIIVAGLLLAYASEKLHKPVTLAISFFVKMGIGAIAIAICNLIFNPFDFGLAINPITATVVGQLGVPGFAALLIMKAIL